MSGVTVLAGLTNLVVAGPNSNSVSLTYADPYNVTPSSQTTIAGFIKFWDSYDDGSGINSLTYGGVPMSYVFINSAAAGPNEYLIAVVLPFSSTSGFSGNQIVLTSNGGTHLSMGALLFVLDNVDVVSFHGFAFANGFTAASLNTANYTQAAMLTVLGTSAGDMTLASFSNVFSSGNTAQVTLPSGFTNFQNNYLVGVSNTNTAVSYKVMDGTETDPVTWEELVPPYVSPPGTQAYGETVNLAIAFAVRYYPVTPPAVSGIYCKAVGAPVYNVIPFSDLKGAKPRIYPVADAYVARRNPS